MIMERSDFKKELARHKNQIDASIAFLQEGFEDLQKRNYEFYEFIEENSLIWKSDCPFLKGSLKN